MTSEARPLHILFFPFMSSGHMIPMADMARIFAAHGVKATILTTPANAHLIQSTIASDSSINLSLIPFPSTAAGLPQGCENFSSLPSQSLIANFLMSLSMLRQPFDNVLTELRPDCVVTDMFFPWTVDVASEHGIPRLVFHGTSYFTLCARRAMESLPPDDNHAESFILPGLPHRIKMLKTQSREMGPRMVELFRKMKESGQRSYGVVVNSFFELEPDYVKFLRVGLRTWHVGPVSLCNKDELDQSGRGSNKPSIDSKSILRWLDSKKPKSVVYVCFGSLGEFTVAQVQEIALGLDASNHPFIWVVRNKGEECLPGGEGRGLVIKGWAPQVLILNHPAVGGFVTHCGWNSSLEGVASGLPMVTWPLFADQFCNERLIVDVLGIGVEVGAKQCSRRPEERELIVAVEVERAVRSLMDGCVEAEGRRAKARELGEKAKRAVEEGGSSFVEIDDLIAELKNWRR